MRRKIIIILALAAMAAVVFAYVALPKGVEDIRIINENGQTLKTIEIYAGDKAELSYNVTPKAFSNRIPEFRIPDTGIATVDENGNVAGVSEGETILIAKLMSCTARVDIKVKVQISDIEGIEDITLTEGNTSQMKPIVKAKGVDEKTLAGYEVTYKSSDEKVAQVDSKGVVTAVAPGEAKITVSVKGFDKLITVNVNAKPVVVYKSPSSNRGGSHSNGGGGNSGGGESGWE